MLHANTLNDTLNLLRAIDSGYTTQFRYDPLFRSGVFRFGDHFCSFSVSNREGETGYLLVNNQELFNVPLPFNRDGQLVFPDTFVATLTNTFTRLHENDTARFRIAAIIIDPGHGGRDPGAVGNIVVNGRNVRVYEREIALRTSLALRDRLSQSFPDKRIIMTRETDVFIPLERRADIANSVVLRDNEAAIFVSIHANGSTNRNARGFEVWHITEGHRRFVLDTTRNNYSPSINAILNAMLEQEIKTESILLADAILDGLGETFGNTLPSRGRKANDWFVVRTSRMPAVLVELGFVTNTEDARLMTSEEGLHKFVNSLYNGISNFIGIFER